MGVELHADEEAARPLDAAGTDTGDQRYDRERPNLAGDLPTVLQTAPMFRRAVVGYDRFQVDTYVQWAEEELATADSEREHLVARLLGTRAALDEARQLLSHSAGGAELLQVSRRVGNLLAAAADEAEGIRSEAERIRLAADAERRAATQEAEQILARADRARIEAEAEAGRLVARATIDAEALAAAAHRLVDEAEATGREVRAEAAARLAELRVHEQRAAEEVAQLRRDADAEASAARLQARAEIVAMLDGARAERRRADAAAAAIRDRLEREAAARLTALLSEVRGLEHRRAALQAEVERVARSLPRPTGGRSGAGLHRLLGRLGQQYGFSRSH